VVLLVARNQVADRTRAPVALEKVGVDGHHVAGRVNAVELIHIVAGTHRRDHEPAGRPPTWTVVREPKPVGVRGVEEQGLGSDRQHHVRVAQIEGYIPTAGRLPQQLLDQTLGTFECVTEKEASPSAFDQAVRLQGLAFERAGRISPVSHRRTGPTVDAVCSALRATCHQPSGPAQRPFCCSQSSRSPICQSFDPPRGVIWASGSARSCSTYHRSKRPRERAASESSASRTICRYGPRRYFRAGTGK